MVAPLEGCVAKLESLNGEPCVTFESRLLPLRAEAEDFRVIIREQVIGPVLFRLRFKSEDDTLHNVVDVSNRLLQKHILGRTTAGAPWIHHRMPLVENYGFAVLQRPKTWPQNLQRRIWTSKATLFAPKSDQ